MVKAYIEIEREVPSWKGKGNINLIPTAEHCAMLHGHDFPGGGLGRTIFKVDTSQANIDAVKASHKDVKVYTTEKEVQLRGLEIRPGTLTDSEVDALSLRLKDGFNIDLKTEMNTTASKSWESYLKQDTESIGENQLKCTNCDVLKNILIDVNPGVCSNCGEDLNITGKATRRAFDISRWADPTVTVTP